MIQSNERGSVIDAQLDYLDNVYIPTTFRMCNYYTYYKFGKVLHRKRNHFREDREDKHNSIINTERVTGELDKQRYNYNIGWYLSTEEQLKKKFKEDNIENILRGSPTCLTMQQQS